MLQMPHYNKENLFNSLKDPDQLHLENKKATIIQIKN